MPRLFTGLEIPVAQGERLMLLRGDIVTARWIAPENFHVTLRFLGDVSTELADEFVSRIARIDMPPFDLTIKGVGFFGTKRAHTLWAGVEVTPALEALHRAHEKAALEVGLEPESRAFTPHVTLARLSRTRPLTLAPFLAAFAAFALPPFEVDEVALYSAKPSTGGGPYVVEEVFPLSA